MRRLNSGRKGVNYTVGEIRLDGGYDVSSDKAALVGWKAGGGVLPYHPSDDGEERGKRFTKGRGDRIVFGAEAEIVDL